MRRRDPLVQGAALARADRALELRRRGQGLLRRLLLHEPGPAAAGMGGDADRQSRTVGRGTAARDGRNTSTRPASRSSARCCRRRATVSRSPTRRISTACRSPASPSPIATTTAAWCATPSRFMSEALRSRRRHATSGTRTTRPRISTAPPHGRRSAHQRGQRRLPQLGHSATCGSATARCFPTVGGVNPSLTIQAIACRTADRIKQFAARGEL